MMVGTLRILLLAGLLASSWAKGVCGSNQPLQAAAEIYESGADFYRSREDAEQYTTAQLYREMQKQIECHERAELCAIESNPWTGLQDGEQMAEPQFKLAKTLPNGALINYVIQLNGLDGKPLLVGGQMQLLRAKDGCWFLADLISSQQQSLARQIELWFKQNRQ